MATENGKDLARALREGRISRRDFMRRAIAAGVSVGTVGTLLQACGSAPTTPGAASSAEGAASTGAAASVPAPSTAAAAGGQPVELLYTFWGSPREKESSEKMVAEFNAANAGIVVRAQHIPTTGNAYSQKMATMLASGAPPDVGYLDGPQSFTFARDGKLLDLSSFFANDAESQGRLDTTFYRYDNKIIGASIGEIMLLYYNRALFSAAGVTPPPSKAAEAWTWDQFLETAKKMTKDRSGNDATSASFDPNNIETYGIVFPQSANGFLPLIFSNGGRFVSEDRSELLLNKPEAVEVLQKMQDLIYVHHVAPTPAATEAFPATDVMMRTGKVAMDLNGHWLVLDYSGSDMEWGMGVLPKFKEPTTMLQASARVIFADTKHPEEAFKFYQWHFSPSRVDLFKKGLWMPPQIEYYKDEAKINEWLSGEPGVYPPEARDVLVDYTLNHTPQQSPVYYMTNLQQILTEAVTPAMQLLWTGKATAQEVADQAVTKAAPLLKAQ